MAQIEELMFQNVAYRPTVYKTGANIDGKKYIKSYELLKKHAKKFAWNIFKAKRFDDAKNVKSRHGYLSGPLCPDFFKFCPKIKRHLQGRNRKIFRSFFGSNVNSKKSFRNYLTFRLFHFFIQREAS